MNQEKTHQLVLLCNAGLSSSFVVDRIEKEFEKLKIPLEISSHSFSALVTSLEKIDLILIAPQLKSMEKEVKNKCEKAGKPYLFVDESFYGFSENTSFIKNILEILEKSK